MTNSRLKLTSSESNWDRARKETSIFDARTGYDRIAPAYDGSPWRRFWRKNEYPVVKKIFLRLLHKYHFKTALDIGAGTGFYSRFFENYVEEVAGVDISGRMLEIAREKSAGLFINEDFLNFKSESKFQFALSARTLSHIRDTSAFFKSIDRNTSEDACVLITDIHPKHNYYKTQFEIGRELIEIETYKHEMREIFNIIIGKYSNQLLFKEYSFSSLPDKWISNEFRSAIGSIDPIFYVILFKKSSDIDANTYRYMKEVLLFDSISKA